MSDPLLEDWDGPFGIAPFERIEDAHFAPAFDEALETARAELRAIADNPEPARFDNTIEALEASGAALTKVLAAFFSVAGADSTPARQALQRDFGPRLAAYSLEVTGDTALAAIGRASCRERVCQYV